jgi:GTP-binding protein
MKIVEAKFLTSAAEPHGYPPPTLPEVALAGRSNVGKSSVINALCQRNKLAITSRTPGRTRLVNFFEVDVRSSGTARERLVRLVDLPGYGFAKASNEDRVEWRTRVNAYITSREVLRAVIHLLDLRHEPTDLDHDLSAWLKSLGIPEIVVLTKADKLSRNQQKNQAGKVERALGVPDGASILFSSLDGSGRDELWGRMMSVCATDKRAK